jgi:hypothetical protein
VAVHQGFALINRRDVCQLVTTSTQPHLLYLSSLNRLGPMDAFGDPWISGCSSGLRPDEAPQRLLPPNDFKSTSSTLLVEPQKSGAHGRLRRPFLAMAHQDFALTNRRNVCRIQPT